MQDYQQCKHGSYETDIGPGCHECNTEATILQDRERIIEALKKLPGSNGRRAEQIIRAMKVD